MPSSRRFIISLLIALVALTCIPFAGMQWISPISLLTGQLPPEDVDILFHMRLPRTMVAFLAGAALSCSGMAFQAMFQNPLATPFTLGVASGASLGAAIYLHLGLSFAVWRISGASVFAFLGAVLSVALVYGISRIRKTFTTGTMLLAGVAMSFFFSSVILFLQYISDYAHSFRIVRWLMGGVEAVGMRPVHNLLPFIAIGIAILVYKSRELNLLTTGEELATSRGVDVKRTRNLLFLATSLMVGGVVSICGPVGFVGMMVPHICRLLVGWNHRILLPACIFFGGTFLVVCDVFSRTVIAPAEIPVGVVTSLLGGPFFLYLLLRGGTEQGFVRN